MNRANAVKFLNTVRDKIDQVQGTEMEKKVKEATSLESWGASRTLKQEIAQATYDYKGYGEAMNMLWKRMNENAKYYRIIFKSIDLLHYLVRNGSDRVIAEARDRMYTLRALREFRSFDSKSGKDNGQGVRDKAKMLVDLLNSDDDLKREREEARKLAEKFGERYGGSSSRGAAFGGAGYAPRFESSGFDSPDRSRERRTEKSESHVSKSKHGKKGKKKSKATRKPRVSESEDESVEASDVSAESSPSPVKRTSKKSRKPKASKATDGDAEQRKVRGKKKGRSRQPKEPTVDDEFEAEFVGFDDTEQPVVQEAKPTSDSLLDIFSSVPSQPPQQTAVFGDDLFSVEPTAPQSHSDDLLFGQPAQAPQDDLLFGAPVATDRSEASVATTLSGKVVKKKEKKQKASQKSLNLDGDAWESGLVDFGNMSIESKSSASRQLPNLTSPGQPPMQGNVHPGYYAAQQMYGAPQQIGYGVPPQQGYGLPQQQAYGMPQQQAYGMPQQPGYGMPQQYPQSGYQQGYQPNPFA